MINNKISSQRGLVSASPKTSSRQKQTKQKKEKTTSRQKNKNDKMRVIFCYFLIHVIHRHDTVEFVRYILESDGKLGLNNVLHLAARAAAPQTIEYILSFGFFW